MKKCLFLDRDGVINFNYGYVHKIEQFLFLDGIFDLVKRANKLNYLTVVVTNQSGIGRGYYSVKDFKNLTRWMLNEFSARGAVIDDVFYSPFHAEHGVGRYKRDHHTRKPKPGMFFAAARKHGIQLSSSVMIGDQFSDIIAAHEAGLKEIYFLGSLEESLKFKPNYSFYQINDFNEVIL